MPSAANNHQQLISALLSRYPIVSDQVDRRELTALLQLLAHVLNKNVAGDVVELGCYVGTTSLFLRRVLDRLAQDKQLHVYDSFAGLPEKTSPDMSASGVQFVAGELHAKKDSLVQNFKHAGLQVPIIHKAWFSELTDQAMPVQIAFAFLDGDYYQSIKDSLRLVWPHMSPGSCIAIDDYASEALPGARRAVDEFCANHGLQVVSRASLGIIQL